jgi:predicted amino acid-binding ACT domain protein
MDSSKREAQNQLEAIKQSILDGRLTHGQICDALAEEIKKELQKSAEEVDIEYVLACQRLIASLHPKKAAQAESHAEHNFQAAHAKLQQEKHSVQKGRKRAIRYGFAVAFLLVVLAGADILLTKRQINVSYSPDHEQIVYDGMMTMPGILEMAGADIQGDAVQELTTKNWDEAVAFLGYVPEMPTWIPDGWVLDEYYCAIFKSFSIFDVTYCHQDSHEDLVYSIERYYGSEPLHGVFEQDGIGYEVVTATGQQLYITSNIGSSVILWHDGSNVNSVIGPVAADELIHMIESMKEGKGSP